MPGTQGSAAPQQPESQTQQQTARSNKNKRKKRNRKLKKLQEQQQQQLKHPEQQQQQQPDEPKKAQDGERVLALHSESEASLQVQQWEQQQKALELQVKLLQEQQVQQQQQFNKKLANIVHLFEENRKKMNDELQQLRSEVASLSSDNTTTKAPKIAKVGPLLGLNNLGNTCYMASALQVLNACQTELHTANYEGKGGIEKALQQLLLSNKSLSSFVDSVQNAEGFLGFVVHNQNDVAHFIERLFNSVQDKQWLQNFALIKTKYRDCPTCFTNGKNIERNGVTYVRLLPDAGTTLQEQIDNHLSYLTDNTTYRDANILHTEITFAERRYIVVGVTMHLGSALGGHYYALVCHGKRWYYCNDGTTTAASAEQLKHKFLSGCATVWALEQCDEI